jgi:hypothetical protein
VGRLNAKDEASFASFEIRCVGVEGDTAGGGNERVKEHARGRY